MILKKAVEILEMVFILYFQVWHKVHALTQRVIFISSISPLRVADFTASAAV